MYYHCRQFKYVTYAKVFPTPSESLDENLEKTYRWLGQYCGFFPQIWLSRSTSKITGVRNSPQNILFGFQDTSKSSITKYFTDIIHDMKSAGEEFDGVLRDWEKSRDLNDYLHQYVFVERDQVVVPSLNLKAAKKVICRNEQQKKKLRQMGFIEDRIRIQNWKSLW